MDDLELINLSKRANVAAASGDISGAIRMYKEVLAQQPDNESVLMHLAALIDDPKEKKSYVQRVLKINPYNEDAKTMLAGLEGRPAQKAEEADPEPVEALHCYYHPDRETTLRCNKCGRPICTECAIRTPVGYRCPDCVREQQDKFYTATTSDIIKGAIVAFVGGLLVGLATLLTIMFLGRFLFFGFLTAFFIGPALGGAVAEAVRRAMGKRHARHFPIIGDIVFLVGILLLLIPFVLFGDLISLGMAALLVIMAISTFYARLKF